MIKILKHMFEERDDFMGYVWMIHECSDPAIKAELIKIAEEESKHYKHLYDIVFSKVDPKNMTHLEHGVHEYATDLYQEMHEILEDLKK